MSGSAPPTAACPRVRSRQAPTVACSEPWPPMRDVTWGGSSNEWAHAVIFPASCLPAFLRTNSVPRLNAARRGASPAAKSTLPRVSGVTAAALGGKGAFRGTRPGLRVRVPRSGRPRAICAARTERAYGCALRRQRGRGVAGSAGDGLPRNPIEPLPPVPVQAPPLASQRRAFFLGRAPISLHRAQR